MTALAPTDRFQPKGDRSEAAKNRVLVAAVEWADDPGCFDRCVELGRAVSEVTGQPLSPVLADDEATPDQSPTLSEGTAR